MPAWGAPDNAPPKPSWWNWTPPLNGYLFVPGNCYRRAFPAGAIDRISSPGGANPDLSTFARLPAPVAGLTFAPDGALYAETAAGAGAASGPAQVVQLAGPGTVLISPAPLVGDIRGGLGGGVAVSTADRRGQASALEAPNREDDVYTFPLSDLPAVPNMDVRSGAATGAGPQPGSAGGPHGTVGASISLTALLSNASAGALRAT
jgi:hypothetical protein